MLGTIKAKQNFNRKVTKRNSLSLNHHQLPGRMATPSLLQGLRMCSVSQSSPTLCNQMDCSPPGSSVYGIFQASVLEWVATSYSRGSSWPWDRTHVSCDPTIAGGFFTAVPVLLHPSQVYPSPAHSPYSRWDNLLKQTRLHHFLVSLLPIHCS